MNKQALKLTRISFDNLENRNAEIIEDCGTFVNDDMDSANGMTAYAKIERFLETAGDQRFYIGWDYNVYPQYKIEKVELK